MVDFMKQLIIGCLADRHLQTSDCKLFLDSMGSGAWPFLVGGVICLVNSVNERDLSLLTSNVNVIGGYFLEGLFVFASRANASCVHFCWVSARGSLRARRRK